MDPTVGRIVHFHPEAHGSPTWAGIVIEVNLAGPREIMIFVFPPGGSPHCRRAADKPGPSKFHDGYWTWPEVTR
jgi:hypothetical protein